MSTFAGYWPSPWSAEDGGPQRLQVAHEGAANLSPQAGEQLQCVTRNTILSTMTVLGNPGEVYLLTHSALRAKIGLPTSSCVEKIDPLTLKTLHRSPRLAGGPMWPGGMAVHRNGNLYVVYGRWAHQLNRLCQPTASLKLPVNEAYNSFVVLDNGLIVTKNLSEKTPARLSVIDPQGLSFTCADTECPEPSIARLSASGNTVYVVSVRSIFRYHWDEQAHRLVRDTHWQYDYIGTSARTYGWDVVLDGRNAWFMDNGKHRYQTRMIGAGVGRGANRLIRVSLADSKDHEALDISGLPSGSITNPPLVDVSRRIVVAYDSANRFMKAWHFDEQGHHLQALWHKTAFGCASHMILYPQSGLMATNDYRRHGEEVVLLDIETGAEKGRVRTGGLTQGVVFPSVGWNRDLYWSSMGRLARVFAG